MGYCFQLIARDISGEWLETFEYAGSWGAQTIEAYLHSLRVNCSALGTPLPDGTLYIFDDTYKFDLCCQILQCLHNLYKNIDDVKVSWVQNKNDNRGFLEEMIDVFERAVAARGFVQLSMY